MNGNMLSLALALAWLAHSAMAAGNPNEATQKMDRKEKWAVVGSGRMDVALLWADAPQLMLKTTVNGPGFKRTRLNAMPEVKDGARAYADRLMFYKDWACVKEPFGGHIKLDYSLSRTGESTFDIRYECQPEKQTRFATPTKKIEDSLVRLGVVLLPGNHR